MKLKQLLVYIFLATFFLFSLFLHFYKINSSPGAVLIDEASLGFNAYSIGQTGKDEFGSSHPLVLKSFGDQKLPLYVYASVIPVKIFGLNPLGIRFVAALSSSLLVFVLFKILKELEFDDFSSLIGSAVAAVSSWTFILGRFGWESCLGLLIFSISILFLIRSSKNNKFIDYVLSGIFLGVTWYSYIPYRIISILVLIAALIFIKTNNLKNKIVLLGIFVIFILPTIPLLLSPAGSARFKQTTILTDPNNSATVNDERFYCNNGDVNKLCSLISNKPVEISYSILRAGVRILSPNYLFATGDTSANYANVGKFALFPAFLIPFYAFGFVALSKIKKQKNKKEIILIFVFSILSLMPTLITRAPQKIQMSSLMPFLLIFIILGYSFVFTKIKYKSLHILTVVLLGIYGLLLLFYFVNIHSKKYYSNEIFMKDASLYLGSQYGKVDKIYFNSVYPNLINYYVFYNKVDPSFYQKNIKTSPPDDLGFIHLTGLNKITKAPDNYKILACKALTEKQNYLFLTNQKIIAENSSQPIPVFVGKNLGGLDLGYIYNLKDVVTKDDCLSSK